MTSSTKTAWLIFAVAAALRLLYLYDVSDAPTFFAPIIDADTYSELARAALATGHFSAAFFWQPFFYPAFLVSAFALGGDSILVVRILQAFIGASTCLLTYRLAARLLPARWATVAGLITACYGPLLFFDAELLGTGWEAFWAVALLLCLLDARATPTARHWARLGAVAALSILTRPTFVPFVAVASLWAAGGPFAAFLQSPYGNRKSAIRQFLRPLLAFLLAFALPLLPASLLSHHTTGSWSILPYSGGLNLYLGNNPIMNETIGIRPGWQWDNVTQLPARYGIAPGRETSRFFTYQTTQYALTLPMKYLEGLAQKTLQCLSARELPRNEDIYLYRDWSALLRLLVWRIGPIAFPFGLLLPLAILGLFHLGRRTPFPLAAFLVLYTAAVILVFPAARYRIPLIPPLAVCAAAGLAALFSSVSQASILNRKSAGLAAALVLAAVLLGLAGPFPQERGNYRAEMYYCLAGRDSRTGNNATAATHLAQAIAINPHYADAHNSLGVALERLDRAPDALASYREALRLNPRNITAAMNAANLLYREKDYPGAADAFEAIAARAPKHKESRKLLAMCMIMQERPAAAIPWLYAALNIDPNDAATHNNLGSALNATGKPDEAVKHFQSAILLDPDLDLAVENLGAILASTGRPDQARLLYRAALVRATTARDPARIAHFQALLTALEKPATANERQ